MFLLTGSKPISMAINGNMWRPAGWPEDTAAPASSAHSRRPLSRSSRAAAAAPAPRVLERRGRRAPAASTGHPAGQFEQQVAIGSCYCLGGFSEFRPLFPPFAHGLQMPNWSRGLTEQHQEHQGRREQRADGAATPARAKARALAEFSHVVCTCVVISVCTLFPGRNSSASPCCKPEPEWHLPPGGAAPALHVPRRQLRMEFGMLLCPYPLANAVGLFTESHWGAADGCCCWGAAGGMRWAAAGAAVPRVVKAACNASNAEHDSRAARGSRIKCQCCDNDVYFSHVHSGEEESVQKGGGWRPAIYTPLILAVCLSTQGPSLAMLE